MSLVQSIYDAPLVHKYYEEDIGYTLMVIKWNGHEYSGSSICCEEDMEFYSKLVGYNIALSRARQDAMYDAKKDLEEEVKWKLRIYQEISNHKIDPENPPFPKLWRNYQRACKRLESINSAIAKEEDSLAKYIEGQAKAINSVRRYRQ
jgi:hypothetical protein